jgi:hypothetical protein
VLVVIACGGSPKPAAKVEPPPPKPTRVIVEDKEPDDGVAIVHGHGHMEKEAIERGVAPHAGEMSRCYTTRVGRRRWLGGRVQLKWDIRADGTVTKVVLAESDLGAWPVEKCLLEVARAATFERPVGGDADFALPLEFSSKGIVDLWDDERAVKAVGDKQLAKLDACSKEEGPPDDVTLTVYVGPRGRAQSVGFASAASEVGDKWAECAEKAALGWKLPDPRGQIAKLAIKYKPR